MPDRFDPLQDLGTTKSKGDHSAPPIPDATAGSALPQRFDGAANFGTAGQDIKIGDEGLSSPPLHTHYHPADADHFDGSGGMSGGMGMIHETPDEEGL